MIRERNLGCRTAISSAINWFFSKEDEGIILEDDCFPSIAFFHFSEQMLEKYRHDERVMMICGTNPMIEVNTLSEDYLFSRHFMVWGWATWKRAWSNYDVDMKLWDKVDKSQIRCLLNDFIYSKYLEKSFDLSRKKIINSWDFQWVFCCLINNGLSIVPKLNLISNIGVKGTNSSKKTSSHFYKTHEFKTDNLKHPKFILPNLFFDNFVNKKKGPKALFSVIFYPFIRQLKIYRTYVFLKNYVKKSS